MRYRHSQQKYTPQYKLERHQQYASAFSLKSEYLGNYYPYISKFLCDPQLNINDGDDATVLFDLLYNSKFGAIHISYYKFLLRRINNINYEWTLKVLSKYVNFLGKRSYLYQVDMFDSLFRDFPNTKLWEDFLKALAPEDLTLFIECAAKYSSVVKAIPKIKLYLLFS
jgi:hypothetical protein